MSSPCPISLGVAAVLSLGLAACHDARSSGWTPPRGRISAPLPSMSQLYPGSPPDNQPPPQEVAFENDPTHISNGKRLFSAYNCNGCHFNGGGGIGPAFMDQKWRYGGSLEEIHNSIAEGRPNGMPVWNRMIPDAQIWEIAAYVHSLSPPPTAPTPPPGLPTRPAQGAPAEAG
jgi:cytochrome c oxidase cbb3-type subunit 3